MTGRTDIERSLERFLADGPERVAERALLDTLAVIDRTPQRRGILAPWRFPRMQFIARPAAAAVAIVIAIGAASIVLGPQFHPSGPAATPTPAPSIVPAPTECVIPAVPGLVLSAGCTYTSGYLGSIALHGAGHFQYDESGFSVRLYGHDSASGGSIEIIPIVGVAASSCRLDSAAATATPKSAAAYIEWLRPLLGGLPAIPVTVGGMAGQEIRIAAGTWPAGNDIDGQPCNVVILSYDMLNDTPGATVSSSTRDFYGTTIYALQAPAGIVVVITEVPASTPAVEQLVNAQLQGLGIRN